MVIRHVKFLKTLMLTLSGVIAVLGFAGAVIPREWSAFHNVNGPVQGIAVLVLTMALALWARYETRIAGLMMMLITLTPLIAETIGQGRLHWGGSSFALMFPGAVFGAIIALSTIRD